MGVTYWKVGVSLVDHMMFRCYHFRLTRNQLILWPEFVMSSASIRDSPLLQGLVMSSHTHHVYIHCTHRVYPIKSTPTGSSHDLLEEEPQQGDSVVYNGLVYCSNSSVIVSWRDILCQQSCHLVYLLSSPRLVLYHHITIALIMEQ